MTSSAVQDTDGLIKAATVSTQDLGRHAALYSEYLGLRTIEQGSVTASLASSWGTPGMAGARYAVMAPPSGTEIFIRLIENDGMPDYMPLRSYGWNAIEICVENVDTLFARLKGSPFKIIGPPAPLSINAVIYPMQAVGPANEVLFLNEVRGDLPGQDLPRARSFVDHIFIMILAAPDRQAAVDFYTRVFGWDEGESYRLKYGVINRAFGLAEDAETDLTMTGVGRLVNNEIDQYPADTVARPRADGKLVPGIAAASYMVPSLDAIDAPFHAPPEVREGAIYGGRRAACCIGPAGELIELIELAEA